MSRRRPGPKRPGVRTAAAFALLAVLACALGCGTGDKRQALQSPSGPRAFADESFAELATDGANDLWMAVAGYRRDRTFGLRVSRRSSSEWAPLPPPPGQASGDLPISVAMSDEESDEVPCVGYSVGRDRKPEIACWLGDSWRSKRLPRLPSAKLLELGAEGGKLIALVLEQGSGQVQYRLLRESERGWRFGPPTPALSGVAGLAVEPPGRQDRTSSAIAVATQTPKSSRFLLGMRRGRWRKVGPAVTGVGMGPMVGGPVVLAGSVLYPVNEADSKPWSFTVYSASIGAESASRAAKLSVGAGNAQGRLDLAGNEVWATWQEDDPRPDGRFRASIFAARLGPEGDLQRRISLWRGISIGPGSTQVVEFRDEPVALYMRSSTNGRGLQATVRALR